MAVPVLHRTKVAYYNNQIGRSKKNGKVKKKRKKAPVWVVQKGFYCGDQIGRYQNKCWILKKNNGPGSGSYKRNIIVVIRSAESQKKKGIKKNGGPGPKGNSKLFGVFSF